MEEEDKWETPPTSPPLKTRHHHHRHQGKREEKKIVESFEIEEGTKKAETGGSHWIACGIILLNGTVGGGLLNMPASVVAAGGFTIGMVFLVVFAFIAVGANLVLVWCSDFEGANSYAQVIKTMLGPPGELFSASILSALMFCTDVYLLVGISDMIQRVMLDSLSEEFYCDHWFVQRTFLSGMLTAFVILPCCLVRHIDMLKYVSLFAIIAIFCVVVVTIYEFYDNTETRGIVPSTPAVWTNVFLAMPGISLGFSNCYGTVSVYSRQKPRGLRIYARAVVIATLMTLAIYVVTSVYAVQLFGLDTEADFVAGFTARNWVVRVAFITYSLKLCFEFPIIQYVGWSSLETLISRIPKKHRIIGLYSRRILISLIWVGCAFTLATEWAGLSYFSALISALIFITMLILPGMCLIRALTSWREKLAFPKLAPFLYAYGVALVVFGSFSIGVVLVQFADTLEHMSNAFDDICVDFRNNITTGP